MGYHSTLKLDYYISFKPQEINVEHVKLRCSGCQKKFSYDAPKFCSNCGSEVVKIESVSNEIVKHLDSLIEHAEIEVGEGLFWQPEYSPENVAIFNSNTTQKRISYESNNETFLITQDQLANPPEMLPDFKKELYEFLEAYRLAYGEDSISVGYGIINYMS